MAELHEIAILSPLPDMLATKFRDTEEIGAEGLPETTPKRKSVAKLVGHVRSLEKLADSPQDATKQENPDKKSSEGRRESESYEEAGAKQLEQFSVMEHSEGPGKVKKMEEERPDTIPSSERHKEREESAFAIEIKQSVNMLWMGHLSSTIVFDIRLNHQQNPIAFFEAMKREPSLVVVLEERCDKATAINPSLISGACVGSTASPWGRGNENRWKYVQFEFGAKCSPKAARHTRISNNDKKGSEIETAANGEMKICLCQNESHDYSYTVAVKVCQEYFFDLGGKKGTHPHPLRQGKELSLLVSVVDYMGTLVARARSRPVA